MSINRIYQGRVSQAELLDTKGAVLSKPDWDWEKVLWEHHALFQDAVNYYLVCLLALANDPTSEQCKIRERMTKEGSEHFVWGAFSRNGAKRRGLGTWVAPYLTPGIAEPTFEQCFKAALAGCVVAAEVLDLALGELLFVCAGESPIKNQGAWMLARFCVPSYNGGFPFDATAALRETGEARLSTRLHELTKQEEWESFAAEVEMTWVVNPTKGGTPFLSEASRDRLHKSINHFLQAFGETRPGTKMSERVLQFLRTEPQAQRELQTLRKRVKELAIEQLPEIPANNRSIPDRLEACILFKYFPGSFTANLLKISFPKSSKNKGNVADEEKSPEVHFCQFGGDSIELARGVRGYVFRAFTSLPRWNPANTPEPQWREFDIAAFKYALTALHQVDAKGKERRAELAELQKQHDYQSGRTAKWKSNGQSEIIPPRLAGDPRIARLRELLKSDLAREYALSDGETVEYGLHPRTIRGFRDVRKKWNAALQVGEIYSEGAREKLWKLLTEYKKENSTTIGSPVLFDAMVEQPNWIIWRDPDAALLTSWRKAAKLPDGVDFASDPLQALTDEQELIEEMRRLKEPIRITPADPEHSRRQFYFSDVVNLTKGGRYRHEPNQCTVIVPLAVKEGSTWREVRVRLHYSAPRLLREGLRRDGGSEDLGAMPWLQPMMAALGLPEPLPQDFRKCPVALMADLAASEMRRILLNFPLTLEPEPLARQLGKAARWDNTQFGPNFKNSSYLRWPSIWDAKAKTSPWWESAEPFRCLAVDLGQRDAGAFALLRVQASDDFGMVKAGRREGAKRQARFVGEIAGQRWFAGIEAAGMLRLPGEDARTLRDGVWKEELSGERGRMATDSEWEEAREICVRLEVDIEHVLGNEPCRRYSFPELNDQLIYAFRRTQARLARLQGWSCVAHPELKEERRARIVEQIKSAGEEASAIAPEAHTHFQRLVVDIQPLVDKAAWPTIAAKIIPELVRLCKLLPKELVRIADRVQPLRGRNWEWLLREDGRGHVMRQTAYGSDDRKKMLAGQRGLSMKRIEQLEEFRHRCQSLNRALRQVPGERAKLGRSQRGVELPDPCPELLDRLDALKEQRVNQTAHLILAQALGVRLRNHAKSDHEDRRQRDVHGEYECIPGRTPVDFLVLENLDRYLATQGRSRSENSRLMKWCHRQILTTLKQLGEPYGLRVLETPAAYSSRFCSTTGVAGFRAVELTPRDRSSFRWKKHLDRLEAVAKGEKKLGREEQEESEHVKKLFDQLTEINADLLAADSPRPKWRTLLAPMAGGPIFVPMRGSPQQADINAAVNLGLRAIAAPDNEEIHLRLRSERKGEAFHIRAENLREKARWRKGNPRIEFDRETDREANLSEARPNFFADLGRVAEFDKVKIEGVSCPAATARGLWGTIKRKVWRRVEEINCARLRKSEEALDTIPM